MSLTITGAVLDGATVGMRCEGKRIAALGPDVVPAPGDETIAANGAPLVAPLLNGHTHAAMTLFSRQRRRAAGAGGDRRPRHRAGSSPRPLIGSVCFNPIWQQG